MGARPTCPSLLGWSRYLVGVEDSESGEITLYEAGHAYALRQSVTGKDEVVEDHANADAGWKESRDRLVDKFGSKKKKAAIRCRPREGAWLSQAACAHLGMSRISTGASRRISLTLICRYSHVRWCRSVGSLVSRRAECVGPIVLNVPQHRRPVVFTDTWTRLDAATSPVYE